VQDIRPLGRGASLVDPIDLEVEDLVQPLEAMFSTAAMTTR